MVEWVGLGKEIREHGCGLSVQQNIHLDLRLEDKVRITGIGEPKDSSELVHSQVPNVTYLQLRRLSTIQPSSCIMSISCETYLSAHLQLNHLDPIGNDGRLVALVQSGVEHFNGVTMELFRKARPFESERHGTNVANSVQNWPSSHNCRVYVCLN